MRNTISIFLVLILVLVTPVLLLVTSIKFNVVTPRFIKHELSTRNVYDLAVRQIDQQIATINIDPQYPITTAEITQIAHQVVTTTWLQTNAEGVIDHTFAWFNAPANTPLVLPIEVGSVKTTLLAQIDALLAAKLPAIKPCPNKRQAKSEQGLCQFAGMTVAQVKETLKHNGIDLAAMNERIPNSLDIVHPDLTVVLGAPSDSNTDQKQQEIMTKLTTAKATYQQAVRFYWYVMLGYALTIAGYLALNAMKGRQRLARWSGILALSVGVLPLAIGIASKIILEKKILPILPMDGNLPADIRTAIPVTIQDLQHAVFFAVLVTGAVLVVLGLGAIIDAQVVLKPAVAKK